MDFIAPAREALAIECHEADHPGIVLGDVNHILIVDIEGRDTDDLGRPDRQEVAVLVEDLDTIVLAVGGEEPAAAVDRTGPVRCPARPMT